MKLLAALAFVAAMPSYAVLTTGDLLSVASCNSVADVDYYKREFTVAFGAPTRNEQGAYWYKASGEVYGTQIKEVFVSSDPHNRFAGVVLEAKPDVVVANVPGSMLYPTNVFPTNNHWVGTDGRFIMWHKGNSTKMFCVER